MGKRRGRGGKLSQEEMEEVNNFVYSKNEEEDKYLKSMTVRTKCRNENQKKLVNSIKDNEITIVSGLPGTGKAQPLYSKVLTKDGWREMGSLKKGEKIITPKGEESKIIGIFPQGKKDIYRITFNDGRVVESCDEHLWKVYYRGWSDKYKVLSLRDIMDNHNKKITDGRLYIPLIESSGNKDIELPMNPYLLGSLIGDYDISSIGVTETSGKKGEYTNLIKNQLNELGLYNKKSTEKFIPEIYKKASKSQKLNLIQGLMDTDGTTDTRRCSVSFSTSSKKLCDDFVELIRSVGGITNVKTKYPKYTYNGELKNGLTNYDISVRYPNPKELFSLKRKKDICENYQYSNLHLKIDKIEFLNKEEAQCIMIGDDEHLYITDNYVVTHNTFLACAEALKLIKSKPKFKRVLLIKSVTQLPGEELGFLPGDLHDKLNPYMISFIDNFEKIIGESLTKKLRELGLIKIQPLAFVRGRSIDNTVIIVDEAQNISKDNMRTLMTRIGDNSKMIILGDVRQKDIKNKNNSSLEIILNKFKDYDGFGCVELRDPNDVVRNPIIKIIESTFDEIDG